MSLRLTEQQAIQMGIIAAPSPPPEPEPLKIIPRPKTGPATAANDGFTALTVFKLFAVGWILGFASGLKIG